MTECFFDMVFTKVLSRCVFSYLTIDCIPTPQSSSPSFSNKYFSKFHLDRKSHWKNYWCYLVYVHDEHLKEKMPTRFLSVTSAHTNSLVLQKVIKVLFFFLQINHESFGFPDFLEEKYLFPILLSLLDRKSKLPMLKF